VNPEFWLHVLDASKLRRLRKIQCRKAARQSAIDELETLRFATIPRTDSISSTSRRLKLKQT
jgi:hypothetical protein